MIHISDHKNAIIKEPLRAPFGFKGAYLTEIWQTIVQLTSPSGHSAMGLGVQSILWSDANVFVQNGEQHGNEMMYKLTEYALNEVAKNPFETPIDLTNALVPTVYNYGQKVTSTPDLRLTFALNALVGIDHAAWSLYSREHGVNSFADLVPVEYQKALSTRHDFLASIPLVPYGMNEEEISQLLQDGYFLLKIKVGADPDQDGDQQKMLEWDKQRLTQIHQIAQQYETKYTESGNIVYYLDANGRYGSKDTFLYLLDHADKIGALDRIILFEEPFDEMNHIDISDVPVTVAADESVHSMEDAIERIDMGYKAMALKPVAKTMSISLQVAKLAHERGVSCFCADLTVNPLMVDWNKNLAGLLAPLPGLKVGALETNGHQNYSNWEQMKQAHPRHAASWTISSGGIFTLNKDFFDCSGGAMEDSEVYLNMLG